jgi:hypothetical protein
MKCKTLPDTIQTIIAQAGGHGLHGAFVYIGAHDYTYRCTEMHGEYRSGRRSKLVSRDRATVVDYEVGLQCRVNGKRGCDWTLIIAYEPDDTYTIWLVEGHPGRQSDSMVLTHQEDVYCDTLQSAIEAIYDHAIQEHNGGFIPLL